jgi:4-hydroxythreonine-4-phosphate dehydrogenase
MSLLITLGDPHSTNIELLDQCLGSIPLNRHPVVLVGSFWHWRDQIDRLGRSPRDFHQVRSLAEAKIGHLSFFDIGGAESDAPAEKLPVQVRGKVAATALGVLSDYECSTPMAVVTMPIDKYAANAAGFSFPGQTDYFEAIWRNQGIMILAGPKLRVALATNHLPLGNVPMAITRDQIVRKLALLTRSLRDLFGIAKPRIAVCGINPHCGENGLLGDEDQESVAPGVKDFNEVVQSKIAVGPVPADTAFFHAYSGKYDAVLAMYHDQGLGPLKTVHFYDAINVTGGLPHLRVSPDHGTAVDLFLKGKASATSTANALEFALRYLEKRPSQTV